MSLQYTGATDMEKGRKSHLFNSENRPTGGGRKKGTLNRVTRQAKQVALRLLEDAKYRKSFEQAWQERKIAPQIEMMVWHYAYGKPKETLALETKSQPQMVELIRQLPEDAKKRLGEAMADLFRAKLQAGDAIDVDATEVE